VPGQNPGISAGCQLYCEHGSLNAECALRHAE
jgi:hypothetical protein